ncbi:MAG: metalloregulator ArsR/SmtB family transcription factor [Oscillospiraceae bacterium]|nr:metalloregulator ArsR/SmtB family transcription factor [Oscillospiraceae bacterium]
MNTDITDFFKCFSDRSRLDIINLLAEGESYTELISDRLSLTPATVSFHLKKLEAVGIASSRREQFYMIYALNPEILDKKISELIQTAKPPEKHGKREPEFEKKVISSFFKYGKLVSIPVQRKKREIVLREILKAFEPGREYAEKEVNLIIADFNDDFCTIRREFIAFNMMARENKKQKDGSFVLMYRLA